MSHKRIRTFTLIEMLIVIVIIGILAAALVPRLQSVQARARDTKRKADLAQIRNALEVYYSDNSIYAGCVNGVCTNTYKYSSNNLPIWVSGLDTVMTSIPVDPINNYSFANATSGWLGHMSNPSQYAYSYYYYHPFSAVSFQGKTAYILFGVLENHQDPDRCAVKQYVIPNRPPYNSVYRCGGASGHYQYIYDASLYAQQRVSGNTYTMW